MDLAKLPKDTDKLPHLMVQAITDSVNKVINENGKLGPTMNAMFVDDDLLADICTHLKPDLACMVEALHIILGNP